MNKKELIAAVAEKSGMTKKDTTTVINTYEEVIWDCLVNGEKVQQTGFGVFDVVERAARTGFNPQTMEKIDIAPSKAVKFRPSTKLKEAVKA